MGRLVLFCVVASGLLLVDCEYVLEFQFHEYYNANGQLAGGGCCDTVFITCDPSCETKIVQLCLYNASNETCINGTSHSPGYIGGNNVTFGSTGIGSLNNPFNYTGNYVPKDGLDLYLKIMDEDTHNNDDLIDEVIVEVSSTLRLVAQSSTVAGEHGRVSLTLSYTLQCESNYYGSNCTKYCTPQDDNNGHYTCDNKTGEIVCRDGWQNPDSNCVEDINECDDNNGGCSQICTNTEGSYECSCKNGYVLDTGSDRHNCSDTVECDDNNGGCSQICNNNEGSFECSCRNGYVLDNDGRNCSDINECDDDVDNGGCSQICINTEGSFECSCRNGYVLDGDGLHCSDIVECDEDNGGCSQICTNTEGSFECFCRNGYVLDNDGQNCSDLDPCSRHSPCANGGTCTNDGVGGYDCSCPAGVTDTQCDTDINECLNSTNPCLNNATCINSIGSYSCLCDDGWTDDHCETPVDSTNSTGSAPSMIVLVVATIILVVLLMVIVIVPVLLSVLYCRRRVSAADPLKSSTKECYASKGSNEHNHTCITDPTNTANPAYSALELKPHQLFDDPYYYMYSIDAHKDNNMHTIPNSDSMEFSKFIYHKETVHPPENAPVTSEYRPDMPSNYEEPLPSSRNIDGQHIYESIDTPDDNDSIPNPLYRGTLPHSTIMYDEPVGVASGVNNPMYMESSGKYTGNSSAVDGTKNVANPAYRKTLPKQEGNGSTSQLYDSIL